MYSASNEDQIVKIITKHKNKMNMDKKSLQRIIPRLSGRRMMSEECFLRKKNIRRSLR